MMESRIVHGNGIELLRTLEPGSVDLIVTDPPYPHEYEHLFGEMAEAAKTALRQGGSLVTLLGHYQLERVVAAIGRHLRYRWIIKLDQPGAHARMAMGVEVTWKPMLWYTNGALSPQRNIIDSTVSLGRAKSSGHQWEQSEDYALWAVESLSDPEDLVADPFVGSGTTAVVCKRLGRRFVGAEIEKQWYDAAVKRVSDTDAAWLFGE